LYSGLILFDGGRKGALPHHGGNKVLYPQLEKKGVQKRQRKKKERDESSR